ncbi:cell wall protein DAN4-like [Melanotaenia boesemani]|uniref:cell wall protein DAN4-like n=1 Tax=Melanotaenia boesemani TaxID=1250792 RepID=UPI001C05794B|nr:cell wall protein DAN4-like [Melanotaenia boesemani]
MMDTKLLMALCALLFLYSVSTIQTPSPNSATLPGEAEASVPTLSPDPTSHAENSSTANQTSSGTSSFSSNTSTENQTIFTNATDVFPAETGVSDKNENSTNQLPSQPPTVPSESLSPTSHASLPPPITSVTHIAHTTHVPSTTQSSINSKISNPFVSLTPGSTIPSEPERPPETTSAPKPEPQNPTISSTTTTTQSSSTSSTSSSHRTPSLHLTTETSQLISHDKTSSTSQPKPTVTPLSRTSTQAKTHSGNPSQLNVGRDTTMAHDSPTLDPLLAGLVSAFIITAVVIVLLLFLKLRRRNNRPEFRRLQDLPMDDMMEDTPLSMYSY